MTKKDENVWQQVEDERGRLRLDRPFTPAEAAQQDAQNLATLPPRAVALGQDRLPDERPRK